MSGRTIRVGCASGFWGDSAMAAAQLVRGGQLDYLVFDYLAEITMSIMARARAKDPAMGYAADFVATLDRLLPEIAAQGITVVSNAGGVNPVACGLAMQRAIADAGLDLKVGVVTGDDLIGRADEFCADDMREMFTNAPLPDTLASINAYLGATPVAEALAAGVDIVITGRGVDSAVTLGPCLHEFGWSQTEFDKLAGGSLAGHIIECGAQATGGIFTDWHLSDDWHNIGYPIVEIDATGGFEVSKPAGTGGLVSFATVAEQMLYEIGDPQGYILPDVVCDFSAVTISQSGPDKVRVDGAKGYAPSASYKVCATYQDGFRLGMYVTVGGIDAAAKAEKTGTAIFARCSAMFAAMKLNDFSETSLEVIGAEASYGPHSRAQNAREVILKLAAKHPNPKALNIMLREATSSGTSMAPGISGMGGNRPKVSPVVRLFSFTVAKDDVPVRITIDGVERAASGALSSNYDPAATLRPRPAAPVKLGGDVTEVPLIALAWGRSGDKGNSANIGIIARAPEYLPFIREALSEKVVADYFAHFLAGPVERYEVPGINALNFVLIDVLGGGGIASLRNDPQGKAYAQMLLDHPVRVPKALAAQLNEGATP